MRNALFVLKVFAKMTCAKNYRHVHISFMRNVSMNGCFAKVTAQCVEPRLRWPRVNDLLACAAWGALTTNGKSVRITTSHNQYS